MDKNFITPAQSKGARAMLGLSRNKLAEAADIAPRTLVDFETGLRKPMRKNLQAIQAALEAAGIEFIPENGGGPGVRLRDRTSGSSKS